MMENTQAIDPSTGNVVELQWGEKLPQGYYWVHRLDKDDWLEIIANIKKSVGPADSLSAIICTLQQTDWEQAQSNVDGALAYLGSAVQDLKKENDSNGT